MKLALTSHLSIYNLTCPRIGIRNTNLFSQSRNNTRSKFRPHTNSRLSGTLHQPLFGTRLQKKRGVSVQYLLPYILRYKCNACTDNLARCDYLLKPTTPPIALDKGTTPTPSLCVVSVITLATMSDVSVITSQSVLVPGSPSTLSLSEDT